MATTKTNIKALFFDIDGTLVPFGRKCVEASTLEAIAKARRKGIKIIIATGRAKAIINNLGALQENNLIDGYVTLNGAYCLLGNKVIRDTPLQQSIVESTAEFCQKENATCIFVQEKTVCVCNPGKEIERIFYDYLHVDRIAENSFENAVKLKTYQLTPFITVGQEERLAPMLGAADRGRWNPAFVDITAALKSEGLDAFCQNLGFGISETMAFGDGGNDIAMLRHAGIGVALGQANENVKAAADYVTTPCGENGIWNALRHFGII